MAGLDGWVMQPNGEEAMAEEADGGGEALQEPAEVEDDAKDTTPTQKKYRKGSNKDVIAFGQPLTQNDRDRIWRMYSRLEHFMARRKSLGNMTTHNQRIRAVKYLAGYSESTTTKVVTGQHKKQKEEEQKLQEELAALPPEPIEVPRSYIRVFGQPHSIAVSLAQDMAHLAELDGAARQAINDRQLLGVEQAPLTVTDLILPSTSSSTSRAHISNSNGNNYNILSEFLIPTPGTQPERPKKVKNPKVKPPNKKRQPSFNKKKGIRTSLTSQRAAGLLPPVERPAALEVPAEQNQTSTDTQAELVTAILGSEDITRNQNGRFVPGSSVLTEPAASTSAVTDNETAVEVKRKRPYKKKTVAEKGGLGTPRSAKTKKYLGGDSSHVQEEVLPEIDSRQMSVWERALVDPLMISSHNTPAVISSLMDATMNAGRARKRERAVDGDEDVMEVGSYDVQVMNAVLYADSLASCSFLPS